MAGNLIGKKYWDYCGFSLRNSHFPCNRSILREITVVQGFFPKVLGESNSILIPYHSEFLPPVEKFHQSSVA